MGISSNIHCTGWDFSNKNPMVLAFGRGPKRELCRDCTSAITKEVDRGRHTAKMELVTKCARRCLDFDLKRTDHSLGFDACLKFERKGKDATEKPATAGVGQANRRPLA